MRCATKSALAWLVARSNRKEATLTNAGPPDSIPSGTANRSGIDAAEILNSVGEVAYDWRIDTDALLWGANAAAVLLIPDIATARPGAASRPSRARARGR